jgi:hypothetical protein
MHKTRIRCMARLPNTGAAKFLAESPRIDPFANACVIAGPERRGGVGAMGEMEPKRGLGRHAAG